MTASQFATAQARIKSPFLEGLPPAELNVVLAAARQCKFLAGTVVTSRGTPADRVFLLIEGRARFFVLTPEGSKILLLWLPEGEVFGVAAMLRRPSDYIVSAETVKDSIVLAWNRPTIRRLALRYPRLLENALHCATEYLTFYVATHMALTCHSAPQRLAAVLLNLSQSGGGRAVRNGIEIEVSNEELAQAANVTHFTASRLISRWQKQGVLLKTRGKILLHSSARLFLARI
jgi:CRP-like cAMP-binding protein